MKGLERKSEHYTYDKPTTLRKSTMKITAWKLVATYEDGHEEDVSTHVRGRLNDGIESLLDALEADAESDIFAD